MTKPLLVSCCACCHRDYTDISIAVATPKGLVVPVLRSVDKLSFAEVEKVSGLVDNTSTALIRIRTTWAKEGCKVGYCPVSWACLVRKAGRVKVVVNFVR